MGRAHPEHPGARPGPELVGLHHAWSARRTTPSTRPRGNTVTIPVSGTAADVRLSITSNTGAPGRAGGRVPGHRHPGAEPGPDRHRHVVVARPHRSRPTPITLSATVRNAGTAASGATNVNFYLGTTKVGTASVGAPRGRRLDHGHAPTSAPGTPAATRSAPRSTRRTRSSSRTTPTTATPTPPRWSSRRSPAPTWSPRRSAWSPGNPAAGNTVTFSVAHQATRAPSASAAGAHGITLTVLNDVRHRGHDADRLVHRRDRRRRHRRPGQPGHLDRRQRQVHRPGRARRRRQRAAGQAGQQHQRPAVLRRPRRQHAVRHVRGRGRRDRRRRGRRRPEPDHRRPRRRGVRPPGGHARTRPAATSSGPPGPAPTRWSPASPSRTPRAAAGSTRR